MELLRHDDDQIADNKDSPLPFATDHDCITAGDMDDDVDEYAMNGTGDGVELGFDPPGYCSSLNHILSLKEDRLKQSDSYLQFIKFKYTVQEEHQARGDSCYQSWKADYDMNNSSPTASSTNHHTTATIYVGDDDDECEIADIHLTQAQSSLDFQREHQLPMQV